MNKLRTGIGIGLCVGVGLLPGGMAFAHSGKTPVQGLEF